MTSFTTRTATTLLVVALVSTAVQADPAIALVDRGGAPGAQERLGNGDVDRVNHVLTADAANNSYLAGSRWNGDGWDWRTTKYNPDGTIAWDAYYATHNVNYPYGIGVDAAGNVYVTGDADNNRYTTVKYSPSGAQLWMRHYDGTGNDIDQPRSLALDAAGNVYVTGRSSGTNHPGTFDSYDFATVKYDTNGVQQWAARYDLAALDDEAMAIAIDAAGSAYVTGFAKNASGKFDYATVKYDTHGVQQWVALYDVPTKNSKANDVVTDGSTVTVTGTASGTGATTIRYDAATGAQLWLAGHAAVGAAITGDASGNSYIAGYSASALNYLTAKYDSAGVQQWAQQYSPPGSNGLILGHSIGVDGSGNVFTSGQVLRNFTPSGSDYDYDVVKYDADGNQQWHVSYDGIGGQTDDEAGAMALRPDGVIVVAGTEAYDQSNGGSDRRTTLFIAESPQASQPRISIGGSVTGQSYSVSVAVRGKVGLPAGSVGVDDGEGHVCGMVLVNGNGSCALANSSAGTKAVTANFSSDAPALFASSTGAVSHTVTAASTALTLGTSGHSHAGDSVTASVAVSVVAPGAGMPTGSVNVGDGVDQCSVTLPATSCDVVLTTPGRRTLTALYSGDGNFASASVTALHRVNRAPVAANDSYAGFDDTPLNVAAANGLLSNDHDEDAGDTLSIANSGSISADGIGGTVLVNADGSFTYTPPAHTTGNASFSYLVSDGLETATATAQITVGSAVNLSITVGNGKTFLGGGKPVQYSVVVSNAGPDTAHAARVSVPVPGNLTAFTWRCATSTAQACATPSGSGAIDQSWEVGKSASVTLTIDASVIALPEAPVVFVASVSAAAAQTEIDGANNSAQDVDTVGIFAYGFD